MSLMLGRARASAAGLGLAVVVIALGGCGSSQTSSQTSSQSSSSGSVTRTNPTAPAAATATSCFGNQLALSYAGTQGATGHLELTVALRNISGTTCRIRGYPGARLVNGRGQVLPLRVKLGRGFFPDTMAAPRQIVLTPGATAHFGISFVTNNEYAGAHVCRTAAAALAVLPGWSAVGRVPWRRVSLRGAPRISPCGNQLVVSPIHD
jgi:hypothetical protein